MVQLAGNFALKCECSREPRRIFKSAHKLLASAHASLAERLRVLVSHLCEHDYCMSTKYSQAFVHVAHIQVFTNLVASSANVCHETAMYVCLRE